MGERLTPQGLVVGLIIDSPAPPENTESEIPQAPANSPEPAEKKRVGRPPKSPR